MTSHIHCQSLTAQHAFTIFHSQSNIVLQTASPRQVTLLTDSEKVFLSIDFPTLLLYLASSRVLMRYITLGMYVFVGLICTD
jgi:hypothetical protein